MDQFSIRPELRSRLYALVSTVPCPLTPGPWARPFPLLENVHGVERLAPAFVFDPDFSSVIRPLASQVGRRLIDVDQGRLDVCDELAADPTVRREFKVGNFQPGIRRGILVDPATHGIRPRDDRDTSVGWPEVVRNLPAETWLYVIPM